MIVFVRRCVSVTCIATALLTVSCSHQHNGNRCEGEVIEDVSEKIKGFDTDRFDFHSWASLNCSGGKIFVIDGQSTDSIIGVFNAADLAYEGMLAKMGPAPEEISSSGATQYDPSTGSLSIFDYGQLAIKRFNVDSALYNKPYSPHIIGHIPTGQFPDRYVSINDSIGIARLIKVPKKSSRRRGFDQSLCRYNINTGETVEFDLPDRQKGLKTLFAVNVPKNRMVECATNNDILTIYDLDGKKIRDIQGPKYDSESVSRSVRFFTHITTSNDKIFALYSGSDDRDKNAYGRYIHVYDLDGKYIKTLDPGTYVGHIGYDESTNRLILICEGTDVQLAYVDLDDLL